MLKQEIKDLCGPYQYSVSRQPGWQIMAAVCIALGHILLDFLFIVSHNNGLFINITKNEYKTAIERQQTSWDGIILTHKQFALIIAH